jgi:hypothetical protein
MTTFVVPLLGTHCFALRAVAGVDVQDIRM